MSQRLSSTFEKLKKSNKIALIPFVTTGYPDQTITVPLLHSMVSNGVNIIELGVPFSDPMADGVAIQKANEVALKQGMTLNGVLKIVSDFRNDDNETPIVLMGYANPIECYGKSNFLQDAQKVGVDAVLVVDMPLSVDASWNELCEEHNINQVTLIAPTTSTERRKKLVDDSTGFIYYVALKGITGSNDLDIDQVNESIKSLKLITKKSIVVGFGIKTSQEAKLLSSNADGVVIGSEIIKIIEESKNNNQAIINIGKFIFSIRELLDKT